MNADDYAYHLANLRELDPDQLVSDLQLTSDELLEAFRYKADVFILTEFG